MPSIERFGVYCYLTHATYPSRVDIGPAISAARRTIGAALAVVQRAVLAAIRTDVAVDDAFYASLHYAPLFFYTLFSPVCASVTPRAETSFHVDALAMPNRSPPPASCASYKSERVYTLLRSPWRHLRRHLPSCVRPRRAPEPSSRRVAAALPPSVDATWHLATPACASSLTAIAPGTYTLACLI
eukprot:4304044-Pleurochrysis_carterae.AAC.2